MLRSTKPFNINVGGTIFTTTTETLEKSKFLSNLIQSHDVNSDSCVPLFIDRDPENFRHVLAFLRDDRYPFPEELEYEFDFYQIIVREEEPETKDEFKGQFSKTELVEAIDKYQRLQPRNYRNISYVSSFVVVEAFDSSKQGSSFALSGIPFVDEILYIVHDFGLQENCSEAELVADGETIHRLDKFTPFFPIYTGRCLSPWCKLSLVFKPRPGETSPQKLRLAVRSYFTIPDKLKKILSGEHVDVEDNIVYQSNCIKSLYPNSTRKSFHEFITETKENKL